LNKIEKITPKLREIISINRHSFQHKQAIYFVYTALKTK